MKKGESEAESEAKTEAESEAKTEAKSEAKTEAKSEAKKFILNDIEKQIYELVKRNSQITRNAVQELLGISGSKVRRTMKKLCDV